MYSVFLHFYNQVTNTGKKKFDPLFYIISIEKRENVWLALMQVFPRLLSSPSNLALMQYTFTSKRDLVVRK